MLPKYLFRKPKITLEDAMNPNADAPSAPDKMYVSCPGCKAMLLASDLEASAYVCPRCGHHMRMNARKRIRLICDADSFSEMDADLRSDDPLHFPEYPEKVQKARKVSGDVEGVKTGVARIGGIEVALFVMNPYFMMGSMGTAVGEKITRLFEYALEHSLPVIGFTVSGGARVQEGILSLMQMAKTSGAVRRHSEAGNLYVVVLTDPTTGGVVASFAMEADIALAEPRALIGFAGPRVIEQTIRQKLPEGFPRADFQLERGFIDAICDRRSQRDTLIQLLRLHGYGPRAGKEAAACRHTTE